MITRYWEKCEKKYNGDYNEAYKTHKIKWRPGANWNEVLISCKIEKSPIFRCIAQTIKWESALSFGQKIKLQAKGIVYYVS